MKTWISTLSLFGVLTLASTAPLRADTRLDSPEPTAKKLFQVEGNWSELKRGWNALTLRVTDGDHRPVTGATVAVVYDMDGMPMNPPDRPVEEKGAGMYQKQVFLGMKGKWKFTTTVTAHSASDNHVKMQDVKQ